MPQRCRSYTKRPQISVAEGIMVLSCSSVHVCMHASVCALHPETLLTRYLAEYVTHFQQTYINDALWDRDECFTVWGQKVKGKGHGGITYTGNRTFWAC